jgi:hypothetical protein
VKTESHHGYRRRWPLCCVALVVSAAARAQAVAPALVVEAPPGLARQAAAVDAITPNDLAPVPRLLGLANPGAPIRVVLAGDRSTLALRAPSWVSGYALPPLATIVLFPARVPSYPNRNLETLVRHEVAHVLLGRATGFRRVPRWFDEGVASVAAREWGVEDAARVVLATIGRGPRSLAEVDAAFSAAEGGSAARGYAFAAALVRDLLRRDGETAIARVLAGISAGKDFETAFRAVDGESPAAFARAYFRREALWNTWVPFLTSATALWMAITLLALLAIKRRRTRDAELRAAWAAEDPGRQLEPPRPPEDDPRRWN